MKKSTLGLAALSFALFASSFLRADDAPYFKKGDVLLEFAGSFNHIGYEVKDGGDRVSGNQNLFYADIGGSYFFTDGFSSGADTFWIYVPSISGVSSQDDAGTESDIGALAIGLEWNARYHFRIGKHFYPYAGVHAGYAWGKITGEGGESDHLTTLGAHLGVDIPINERVFFDVQLKYTDYGIPVDGLKLDTLRVLLGLKIKL